MVSSVNSVAVSNRSPSCHQGTATAAGRARRAVHVRHGSRVAAMTRPCFCARRRDLPVEVAAVDEHAPRQPTAGVYLMNVGSVRVYCQSISTALRARAAACRWARTCMADCTSARPVRSERRIAAARVRRRARRRRRRGGANTNNGARARARARVCAHSQLDSLTGVWAGPVAALFIGAGAAIAPR